MEKREAYYFSVAAILSAAVAEPSIAKAVCSCVWKDVKPASVVKTYSQEVFLPLSGTTMYVAELSSDGLYTFKTPNAPTVYFDYKPTSSASTTITYQVCRISYLGTGIACGTPGAYTTTSTSQVERVVPISSGVYSATMSDWDRIFVSSYPSTSHTPVTVPVNYVASW